MSDRAPELSTNDLPPECLMALIDQDVRLIDAHSIIVGEVAISSIPHYDDEGVAVRLSIRCPVGLLKCRALAGIELVDSGSGIQPETPVMLSGCGVDR